MKSLKFLSFVLLLWVLVIAWCEKANNQEKLSCESDDICSIEIDADTPSVEIEQVNEESVDQPMMRKMLVDEDATAEEIEQDMVSTCANVGWIWGDWICTLEDGSVIAF